MGFPDLRAPLRAVLTLVTDALERRSEVLFEKDPIFALDVVQRQVEVCRALGDSTRLAQGIAAQAILLSRFLNRPDEAARLAEEGLLHRSRPTPRSGRARDVAYLGELEYE